jgi:hypothetical protein
VKTNKGQWNGPWLEWDEDVESESEKAIGSSRPIQWYDEEFWVDYVEGETNEALAADLSTLLKNSPRDRRVVDGLKSARDIVGASLDEPTLPESGEFYSALADRIMSSIDEQEEKEKLSKQTGRKLWRGGVASTSVVVGIIALVSLLIGQNQATILGPLDTVVLTQAQVLAKGRPEVLVASSTTVSAEDRQSLVVEALAVRMATLSPEQSAELLGQLAR